MVIITRSAHKKAYESVNSSDVSQKNIIPPWCSSGKVNERKKYKKIATPKWEMRSSYPLRENIWEYLYEDTVEQNFTCNNKKRKRRCKQTSVGNQSDNKLIACCIVLFALGIGTIVSFWKQDLQKDLTKVFALSFSGTSTAIREECCHKLKHLTEELAKAEHALRSSLRSRVTMLSSRTKTVAINTRYISGAIATKGDNTKEWDGRITLWGILPLWRVAPPPSIVLALRPPSISDCWPFIGSYGEILIRLPKIQRISYVTIEHVHPDMALSAPNHFVIYGVLANNTAIKVLNARYKNDGPPKQYYRLAFSEVEWKGLKFRVLTNQGNKKYTCVYRLHLYENYEINLIDGGKLIHKNKLYNYL